MSDKNKTTEDTVTEGSGNVFADLGIPNATEHKIKADLVIQIKRLIADQSLTQTAAARRANIPQPDLSKWLGGHFRGVSVERLIAVVTGLGQDVDITIMPRRNFDRPARVRVFEAA